MIKCYFCDEEGIVTCDWCNHSFCKRHWATHTNIEGAEIEAKERDAGFVYDRIFNNK